MLQRPNTGADQYMQNMNLYRLFEVEDQEMFNRHPANGRFCRMCRIKWPVDTDALAQEMASTVQVDDVVRSELLPCLEESFSNLYSHAQAGGYAAAQSYKRGQTDEYYELAICDPGVGIRFSLTQNAEYTGLNDQEALEFACKDGVSRCYKVANSEHFGVGLWQIEKIVESTGGTFYLASGTCLRERCGDHVFYQEIPEWCGTIMMIRLHHRGIVERHERMVAKATGRIRHG